MIYDQTVNPLKSDLLWGISIKDCVKDRKNNVEITMVHALAKVNISLDESLGNIGTVIVSAYKTGWFSEAKMVESLIGMLMIKRILVLPFLNGQTKTKTR